MKDHPTHRPSRRHFIQLAAASASILTASKGLSAEAERAKSLTDTHPYPQFEEVDATSDNGPIAEAHATLNLNGMWSVTALPLEAEGPQGYETFVHSSAEQLAAQVPGEIHLDLMRAGKMEDPSISDNARTRCRWPEQHSWWYRTEFTLPSGFRHNLRQRLIFEGIDLYGQIFVNGKLAGTGKNAFATLDVDVKALLREGNNELVVRVTSGMEFLRPVPTPVDAGGAVADPLYAMRTGDSHVWAYLRKPDYAAYGTDFNDPLPNIGIWRSVRLEGRTKVVIDHLCLDTSIRGKEVSLEGEVILENLHPWSEIATALELRVDPPRGDPMVLRLSIGAPVGRSSVPCRIVISNPQLWWPNGMGDQPLYRLTLQVICGGEETDRRVQHIGLRTLELDRSPSIQGSRFCFKVNGQDVFCKGGNWAPDDLIAARTSPARYQSLVSEAKRAHFTMFRVNGVGLYETDEFYAACDRAGILVWQDFTFSDAQYPDQDPAFLESVRNEAECAVRRLRHHASLALWCGNSECNWFMAAMWKSDASRSEEIGGVQIYNEVLPDICRQYDPVRPYWPGSPMGGIDPNSGTSGDTHGPLGNSFFNIDGLDLNASEVRSVSDRNQRNWQALADQMPSRFASEYGVIGPPNIASVSEYLKPDEVSLNSLGWKIHVNAADGGTTASGIEYHYGQSRNLSLPTFILYGQMYQAMLLGGFLEARRFHKGDSKTECQGTLMWSYNDTWGETGWSIIDHYMRRKASYYWFRRAAAPVKVLVRSREGRLVTRVVNDTLKSYRAMVLSGWVRVDGSSQELRKYSVRIPANGMIEVCATALPSATERNPQDWVYAATLEGDGIPEDQAIWRLAPHRSLALGQPLISVDVQNGMLAVHSPVYCHGLHLEDEGHEILADNYFDLLPHVPRHIPITMPVAAGSYPLVAVMPIVS
jgi:beta-mannosidase